MRQDKDPLGWCALIALGFLVLARHRLALPSTPYFDEVHYVRAARNLLDLVPANREHPMFAKEVIAASIALFGDRPPAWRMPSVLFGTFGLFAFGRLIWWTSQRRFATIAGMILLATNVLWFVQSRIAMLDIFAASLTLAALWQFAATLALPERNARQRLALTGIALGLAMGAKWSVVPVAVLPGLAFLSLKLFAASPGPAVQRIPIHEAAIWLGVLPLAVYWATFAPAFFYDENANPVSPLGFVAQHREMIALQNSVTSPHPYQSGWSDWIINRRPVWYLYEEIDGAQRGVLLLGNPLAMLAGLPALLWCVWTGLTGRRKAALAFAGLYLVSMGFWALSGKPVQFYYHYLLPATFLMGCLALALDALTTRSRTGQALAVATLAFSASMFAWFYPILSAAALEGGAQAFMHWMWLDSWR